MSCSGRKLVGHVKNSFTPLIISMTRPFNIQRVPIYLAALVMSVTTEGADYHVKHTISCFGAHTTGHKCFPEGTGNVIAARDSAGA